MLKKWRDKQFAFIWIPIILCPFIFLVGIIMGRSLTSCTTERAILSDPDKLAKLVRERYVCNLPSDNRCGHEGDLFRTFERNGLHLLPVHFYSAIPEVSRLSIEDFKRPIVPDAARSICEEDPISDKCPILQPVGINLNIPMQLIVVDSCKPFQNEMAQIPSVPLKVNGEELFHSRWVCSQHTPPGKNCPPYGALDAQLYHCIIRTARPALVMEIGSGHSTYVALEALRLAMQESRPGGTYNPTLVSIEPYPSAELRAVQKGLQFELIEKPVQKLDPKLFAERLQDGDILFIDSTHVVAPGSDVVHIFTKVLPRLRPGVLVHVHDICLPFETAWDWTFKDYRFWSEQYLLHSMLAGGDNWEILYMGAMWEHYLPGRLARSFPLAGSNGALWMRRRGGSRSIFGGVK